MKTLPPVRFAPEPSPPDHTEEDRLHEERSQRVLDRDRAFARTFEPVIGVLCHAGTCVQIAVLHTNSDDLWYEIDNLNESSELAVQANGALGPVESWCRSLSMHPLKHWCWATLTAVSVNGPEITFTFTVGARDE